MRVELARTDRTDGKKIQNGNKKKNSNSVILLAPNNFRITLTNQPKKKSNEYSAHIATQPTDRHSFEFQTDLTWKHYGTNSSQFFYSFWCLSLIVLKRLSMVRAHAHAPVAQERQYETNGAAVARCCWPMFLAGWIWFLCVVRVIRCGAGVAAAAYWYR